MSRICDCSQIQLRRAKNHYCSATARSLFFFLCCLFFGQSKDPRMAQGFADALDTRGRTLSTRYLQLLCTSQRGRSQSFSGRRNWLIYLRPCLPFGTQCGSRDRHIGPLKHSCNSTCRKAIWIEVFGFGIEMASGCGTLHPESSQVGLS